MTKTTVVNDSAKTSGTYNRINTEEVEGHYKFKEGCVLTPQGIVQVYSQEGYTRMWFVYGGRTYGRHFNKGYSERYLATLAHRFAKEITQASDALVSEQQSKRALRAENRRLKIAKPYKPTSDDNRRVYQSGIFRWKYKKYRVLNFQVPEKFKRYLVRQKDDGSVYICDIRTGQWLTDAVEVKEDEL
jgi:hypothetical protein